MPPYVATLDAFDYCPAEKKPATIAEDYAAFARQDRAKPDVAQIQSKSARELAKEQLIARLQEFPHLPINWDGYGGRPASHNSIGNAVYWLLRQLHDDHPLPQPMLTGSGIAGMFWKGNGYYASIDFEGDGFYTYIAEFPDRTLSGEGVSIRDVPPPSLIMAIAATR